MGLDLNLTKPQSLILALIGKSYGYESPFLSSPETLAYLANLLGKGDTPQRIWLPPDATLSISSTRADIHFDRPLSLLLCVAGRRSGKTTLASILLSWLVRTILYDPSFLKGVPLLPNSTISILNAACDLEQARILFQMLKSFLKHLGLLTKKGEKKERAVIKHERKIEIESLSSSSRSARGRTAAGVCLDEFAHFQRTTGPYADRAMWLALIPSLASFMGKGLAIITTSPAGRSGVVWELFQEKEERLGMLTVQLPTWEMNPHLTRESLESEFRRDEFMARQEYEAEFLAPQGEFLNWNDIKACTEIVFPKPSWKARWQIHVDLGLVRDATAIAVGYLDWVNDEKRIVITKVEVMEGTKERPLNVGDIEKRILEIISEIKESPLEVSFDQHQSAYLIERLKSAGIRSAMLPATSKTNEQSYALLRDLVSFRRIKIPNNPRLIDELLNLECTPTTKGFKVEAAPGKSDDCADSVAMCAWRLMEHESAGWKDLLQIVEKAN